MYKVRATKMLSVFFFSISTQLAIYVSTSLVFISSNLISYIEQPYQIAIKSTHNLLCTIFRENYPYHFLLHTKKVTEASYHIAVSKQNFNKILQILLSV